LTSVYTEPHTGGLRSDHAYVELKHRLLVGDFPVNTRLAEARLAAAIGVSRTPIREALHRLHSEGLVKRSPDGGYEPVAPDVTGMRHLYEVRAGLEMQALQRPGRFGRTHDGAALEALRDEWLVLGEDEEPEPDPGFVVFDEAFHVTLAEAAGNPALADLLRQVNDRIRIVRMQDFLTEGRIGETVADHLGILDAVLDGDLATAEQRFTSHLDGSIAVVEERVNRAIARMVNAEPT
jgi:DNA-binding GntR family transcriptional regulator